MDKTYHSLLPHHRHAILDSVHAIGNLPKVVLTHGFLISVKGTVIRTGQVEVAATGEQRVQVYVTTATVRNLHGQASILTWTAASSSRVECLGQASKGVPLRDLHQTMIGTRNRVIKKTKVGLPTSGMSPAPMPVTGSVRSKTGSNGFSKHHTT